VILLQQKEANMARQRHEDEDDDDDDDHRILRDGEFLHVPMMMMDALQRSVFQDSITRGLFERDDLARHRPGYRHSINDVALDAKEQAYRDAERTQTNAWRSNDAEPSDEQKEKDREIPLRQITGDSRVDAYLIYQEDVQNRWRGAR
jgi:hypothetical protein